MNPSTAILRDMIRSDLELAFEHLCNDQVHLFLHELHNAQEKAAQIQSILDGNSTLQPLLIEAEASCSSQGQPKPPWTNRN